jgi:hypothetical protein
MRSPSPARRIGRTPDRGACGELEPAAEDAGHLLSLFAVTVFAEGSRRQKFIATKLADFTALRSLLRRSLVATNLREIMVVRLPDKAYCRAFEQR